MRKPFFPIGLNVDGRCCIVIGPDNDREAIEKSAALRESGALVVRINESSFSDEALAGAFFVISTPQDAELSARLRKLADRDRFLLCCIDQPRYGFVAMTALAMAGPVRIAISTAGLAPRVGKKLKEALQRAMDAKFARFIEQLAQARERERLRHPQLDEAPLRRKAMIQAARGFEAEVTFNYPPWFE